MSSNPNEELQLAREFIRHTHEHLFLTGRAGTGKTTFLRELREHPPKRLIVTAPTGVAAMNAQGVTLHSFFQLPFGPMVPETENQRNQFNRYSKEKLNIIRSLDLLVIDEISMVRADLLDGIDRVLRRYRDRNQPFGGVQLLLIGDLHQLPPVVKNDELELIQKYYETPYFFSSLALKQTQLVTIELQKIYRQSDEHFIHLLNEVRDGQMHPDVLTELNTRCQPDLSLESKANAITLTTHVRQAEAINRQHLDELPTEAIHFSADVDGEFPEYLYPVADQLTLKLQAQVMFTRNDPSVEKRYFNGKIGIISAIDDDHITVSCPEDEAPIIVDRATWENQKYGINDETNEIVEEVVGQFTQFPLRLAWAMTIHKSQGLTFDRVVIDANAAFAHGQVYVALSRCRSLQGLILSSPIHADAVITDAHVAQFVQNQQQNPPDQQQLFKAKITYQQRLILECFDFQLLRINLGHLGKILQQNQQRIEVFSNPSFYEVQQQAMEELVSVGEKFKRQLISLFQEGELPEQNPFIQERVTKGAGYYQQKLQHGLTPWAEQFRFETDNKEINKRLSKSMDFLHSTLNVKNAAINSCLSGFDSERYLQEVANARVEKNTTKRSEKTAEIPLTDVANPELFETLKNWRKAQAKEQNLDPYRIIHLRVLAQIATHLPQSKKDLLQLKGVGKKTIEKLGDELLPLVQSYCDQHQITAKPVSHTIQEQQDNNQASGDLQESKTSDIKPPQQSKQIEDKPKIPSHEISFEMFKAGKSLADIANTRGLVLSTIENHLAHYVRSGEIDIHQLIEQEKINIIQKAFDETPEQGFKAIKSVVGDDISYGEIRLVHDFLQQQTELNEN